MSEDAVIGFFVGLPAGAAFMLGVLFCGAARLKRRWRRQASA